MTRADRLAAALVALALSLTGASAASAAGTPDPGRSGPAIIDPGVGVQGAAPDQLLQAIVVLRGQADLRSVTGLTRRDRLASVERSLRDAAATRQRGVLGLLRARSAEGKVSAVTPLWISNEVSITATPSVIRELADRPDVAAIRPELMVAAPVPPPNRRPSAATTTTTTTTATGSAAAAQGNLSQVNAPAMWDLGFRGQGVVVANLDTGVDVTHPDLASRWRGGSNSWFDPNGQHPSTPVDVNGHGTWTMGVMVGGDASGTSIGIAPGATWIAAKIFNDRGVATSTGIHQAFQWVLDPDHNPATADAPNIVNNSWTMSTTACATDFQQDLTSLRAAGILPVFAAGNSGPVAGSVYSPANLPQALAVGAVDGGDVIEAYSSRGPSACGQALAPALTAPGDGIHTTDLYGLYADLSGTSMAAPHASGALALLLSALGPLSADRQQTALESGAVDLGPAGADNDYGHGRLDVLAAYRWLQTAPDYALSVSPPSASVPAGGSASFTVSSTASNGFTGDVALSISGLPAGQATASFAPGVVPGGAGTAHLSISTAAGIPPGSYPLTVIGSSGSTTRTAGLTLTVPAPAAFGVAAAPSSVNVAAGASAGYTVTVSAQNGFSGTVALSLAGLPAGVGTATFAPASISTAGTSQLTVQTPVSAPAGSYPLTVSGTSAGVVHSVGITLTVTPAPDFGVSASPASRTVYRGQSAAYQVTVSSTGGFTGSVTLTRSGVPSGTTVSWSANPVAAPGAATLTLRTSSATPRGTYSIGITGTSGSLSHRTTVTLTVR